MAISDIRKNAQPRPKRMPCSVCTFLRDADPGDRAELVALLRDRHVRYQWLSEQLRAQGVELSAFMLGWHTRGRCAAGKKLR